eukprot:scaffold15048_cov82-Skeletonema_marinoi.AAC.1
MQVNGNNMRRASESEIERASERLFNGASEFFCSGPNIVNGDLWAFVLKRLSCDGMNGNWIDVSVPKAGRWMSQLNAAKHDNV